MNLNLDQHYAFVFVARHRNFGRAAAEMGISDRLISQHIKRLEKSLGQKLFIRDTRYRRITPVGKLYLSHIEPLLISLQEKLEEMRLPEPPAAGDIAN